jgi:hypothetical protein
MLYADSSSKREMRVARLPFHRREQRPLGLWIQAFNMSGFSCGFFVGIKARAERPIDPMCGFSGA